MFFIGGNQNSNGVNEFGCGVGRAAQGNRGIQFDTAWRDTTNSAAGSRVAGKCGTGVGSVHASEASNNSSSSTSTFAGKAGRYAPKKRPARADQPEMSTAALRKEAAAGTSDEADDDDSNWPTCTKAPKKGRRVCVGIKPEEEWGKERKPAVIEDTDE